MNTFGARDLGVAYGRRIAVEGVTFEVTPGDIVAFVGGDGAGKTSVLRALAGVVAPAQGEVLVPGERDIGYVPGSSGIYQDLTAEENLSFAGAAYGLKGRRLAERIDALLASTGLVEARARLAGRLSGGMRQKLALATALVHEPRLLVLDEATTGLDPVSRGELWRNITRAAADGAAIVFSTTYIEEAERAARVVALHDGRVLVQGRPHDIVSSLSGSIVETDARPAEGFAYRRGARFRAWHPDGVHGGGAVSPDLQDAIIIAALRARAERGAA